MSLRERLEDKISGFRRGGGRPANETEGRPANEAEGRPANETEGRPANEAEGRPANETQNAQTAGAPRESWQDVLAAMREEGVRTDARVRVSGGEFRVNPNFEISGDLGKLAVGPISLHFGGGEVKARALLGAHYFESFAQGPRVGEAKMIPDGANGSVWYTGAENDPGGELVPVTQEMLVGGIQLGVGGKTSLRLPQLATLNEVDGGSGWPAALVNMGMFTLGGDADLMAGFGRLAVRGQKQALARSLFGGVAAVSQGEGYEGLGSARVEHNVVGVQVTGAVKMIVGPAKGVIEIPARLVRWDGKRLRLDDKPYYLSLLLQTPGLRGDLTSGDILGVDARALMLDSTAKLTGRYGEASISSGGNFLVQSTGFSPTASMRGGVAGFDAQFDARFQMPSAAIRGRRGGGKTVPLLGFVGRDFNVAANLAMHVGAFNLAAQAGGLSEREARALGLGNEAILPQVQIVTPSCSIVVR